MTLPRSESSLHFLFQEENLGARGSVHFEVSPCIHVVEQALTTDVREQHPLHGAGPYFIPRGWLEVLELLWFALT